MFDSTSQSSSPSLKNSPKNSLLPSSKDPDKRSFLRSFFKSLGFIVAAVSAIVSSLLVFPEHIHWMMLAWVFFSVCTIKTKWSLIGIACCLVTVLIKQPGWSLPFIQFVFLASAACCVFWKQSNGLASRGITLATLALVCTWYSFDRCAESTASSRYDFNGSRPIVCLGDSLTDFGYPEVLRTKLSVDVLDFGRDGYSAKDAIEELLPEIEKANPACVIVELGGHDFKNGDSRTATYNRLIEIVQRIKNLDAEVILVEIPRGFVNDPYHGLEREIAGAFDLQLIPDTMIRRFIFWSPIVPPGMWTDSTNHLSKDGLHPNSAGNELFANYVQSALVRLYGNQILK